LPRESRICRAWMRVILVDMFFSPEKMRIVNSTEV
jgi:hypothetical protein